MTAGKECTIDIEGNINTTVYPSIFPWVSKVKNELENLTANTSKESEPRRKQSIYRVSSSMKDLRGKAYRPQMVSIGPYHHGDKELEAMEEHKHRALIHFLVRSGKPLESYLIALDQVADDLKDAYDRLDERWKRDTGAFPKLMMVDGCFVLELLRTTTVDRQEGWKQMGYADNDPVFSNHVNNVPFLKPDMLLLENQLPLPVLTTLLAVEKNTGMTKDDLSEVRSFRASFSFRSSIA